MWSVRGIYSSIRSAVIFIQQFYLMRLRKKRNRRYYNFSKGIYVSRKQLI